MRRFGVLIRCVGEAVAAQGAKCLLGLLPFGDRLYDIAQDAGERYRQRCQEQEALAQVEAAAQASLDEVKAEALDAVADIRAGLTGEVAEQMADPEAERALVSYLEQVPSAIRSTLRRPADPTGRSLPRQLSVAKPEDFSRLLPARPPRFRPGDHAVENWVLSDVLGVGGFGEVWKAEHAFLSSQPPVALKFCLSPEASRYLRHESEVMEPLHRLNPPVVHRDLKPANVLVVRKEGGKFDLKVTDFGIGGVAAGKAIAEAARGVSRGDLLSQTLRGSHTPLYASPEQARGGPPTRATTSTPWGSSGALGAVAGPGDRLRAHRRLGPQGQAASRAPSASSSIASAGSSGPPPKRFPSGIGDGTAPPARAAYYSGE